MITRLILKIGSKIVIVEDLLTFIVFDKRSLLERDSYGEDQSKKEKTKVWTHHHELCFFGIDHLYDRQSGH